jgi:hypothetical protein
MPKNDKTSSKEITELAAQILGDKNASEIAKKLAGSVLSQFNSGKQTGREMEELAAKVLQSPEYRDDIDIKRLAGSVLSQSNKER